MASAKPARVAALSRCVRALATSRCARALATLAVCFGCALLTAPAPAAAAEVTDVLDAFDSEVGDPFDFGLRLRFLRDNRQSTIGREFKCLKNDAVGSVMCPKASGTVLAREIEYERVRSALAIDARFGLFKDVEAFASFPIVLSDQWQHKFAAGVSHANSIIDPLKSTDALFAVPFDSTQRAGFGDMTLGLKWAPFNYYRDETQPTWVLGLDFMLPTGTPMKADNDGVGLGMYEMLFHTTISRRALRIFEPFFNLHGAVRFGADDGLFSSTRPETQPRVDPSSSVGTQFGMTFLPWENVERDERVEVEAGFGMDYFFRGREYTEVWEALASADNPCKPSEGCSNILHTRSEPDESGALTRTNGVTEIEPYGRFQGWAALHYQPVKYFQISAKFGWMQETPHFLTFGEYGVDLDRKSGVEQSNSEGKNEYSPVFLPSVDTPGQRLRLLEASQFSLMLAITGKI